MKEIHNNDLEKLLNLIETYKITKIDICFIHGRQT